MSKSLKVAIIGIGPAAMATALAVNNNGGEVYFYSRSLAPSPLYGCQYLHMPLPGQEDVPRTTVRYEMRGTPEEYRRKVYGNAWKGRVSPEDYLGDHEAWDLRATYRRLHANFLEGEVGKFTPFNMSADRLRTNLGIRDYFDLVVSTAPTPALCARPDEHTFASQQVYAAGDAPQRGMYCPIDVEEDTIFCEGRDSPSWYRASRVFGYSTIEWPGGKQPPYDGVVPINKPLWTDCECFPWIERLGRFGSWRKEILIHDVYEMAQFIYRVKASMAMLDPRRADLCEKCGRAAYASRPLLDSGKTEYRCLDGHVWEYCS